MKYYVLILALFLLTIFDAKAQDKPVETSAKSESGVQSPELKEAEQLSAEVFKLYRKGKFQKALPLAEKHRFINPRGAI